MRFFLASAIIAFLIATPVAIKTEWYANHFLTLSGPVSVELTPELLRTQGGSPEASEQRHGTNGAGSSLDGNVDLTFEAWLCMDVAESPATFLSLKEGTPEREIAVIRKEKGKSFVAQWNLEDQSPIILAAEHSVRDGQWFHLALVLRRGSELDTLRFYVSGNKRAEATLAAGWRLSERMVLNVGGTDAVSSFSGKIDDVRISSVARYTAPSHRIRMPMECDDATLALQNFDGQNEHERRETFMIGVPSNRSQSMVRFQQVKAAPHNDDGISVEWQTTVESDMDGFVIQRRDASMESKFEDMGFMPAAGSSSRTATYRFVDFPEKAGRYYYRLACVDVNNLIGYSPEFGCDVQGSKDSSQ